MGYVGSGKGGAKRQCGWVMLGAGMEESEEVVFGGCPRAVTEDKGELFRMCMSSWAVGWRRIKSCSQGLQPGVEDHGSGRLFCWIMCLCCEGRILRG